MKKSNTFVLILFTLLCVGFTSFSSCEMILEEALEDMIMDSLRISNMEVSAEELLMKDYETDSSTLEYRQTKDSIISLSD